MDPARAQGPVQVHLLTARLDQPGLVIDQVSGTAIRARAPLTQWLRADDAVAGVNADFFDINDTGAPLGVGADRQRRLLHSPRSGWNNAFLIDSAGTARVMVDPFHGRVVPRVGSAKTITNFNSPVVAPGGIGLYTYAWGRTAGRNVVNGARRVRQVAIRDGVVRSNSTTLSRAPRSPVRSWSGAATAPDGCGTCRSAVTSGSRRPWAPAPGWRWVAASS